MTAYSKQLIIFSKNGTLSPGLGPISAEMAQLLTRLLERKKVAIISGSGYPRFETDILAFLPHDATGCSNLFLLPLSGTRFYSWRGGWNELYAQHLAPREKEQIMTTFNIALSQCGIPTPERIYGHMLDDRGSQITFSALGGDAPAELKRTWDPDLTKRRKLVEFLQGRIPEYDFRIGGTTSIDVTKKGLNKAYGVRRIEEHLKLSVDDMVFIGDAFYPGGNDTPAKATGVDFQQVSGPEETAQLISSWMV